MRPEGYAAIARADLMVCRSGPKQTPATRVLMSWERPQRLAKKSHNLTLTFTFESIS